MAETILRDHVEAYGFSATALRYFNAAGADPDGDLCEEHDPEAHLLPIALRAASGARTHIDTTATTTRHPTALAFAITSMFPTLRQPTSQPLSGAAHKRSRRSILESGWALACGRSSPQRQR
jgi:hypothetical protein